MTLNLPILNLNTLDSLSYQKCLIPANKFPKSARPGHWAKCYFVELVSKKEYYSVAQIFPRDDLDNMCYLDTCVTNYDQDEERQLVLDKLIVLETDIEIRKAKLVFQLNPQCFIQNSDVLTKNKLLNMAKILLQKYHLTNNCIIRDIYLSVNGIDSISVQIDNNCEDSTHTLTDNACISIYNICLTHKSCTSSLISLNVKPFARARRELENLICCLRSQRCHLEQMFCTSLNVTLVGTVGCGKTTLVEEVLQSHRCNVFRIKITNCLREYPGETEAELRKIFKAACDYENNFKANDPTVILLEELHLLCPQATSSGGNNSEALNYMRIITQLMSLVDGLSTSETKIMCLATTSNSDNLNELVRRPGRFGNEIRISPLQEEDRFDILNILFTKSMPNFKANPTTLLTVAKQTQGYILSDLALLVQNVSHIMLTKSLENFENIAFNILRKSKPISLKATDISVYKTTETFDSIGGMIQLKTVLKLSVLAGIKHQASFQRFNLSLPKGILLFGPPGCAKTTIAKCLATEANMTFIATSGAELYSPYVGCAEKFLAKIFETARKSSPCLIFLDEIDSLVGRRSLANTSNSSDVQVRILSTLLTEMDGIISPTGHSSNIIVVAATNRPDMVDDALMRPGRFDKLIHVPAPDLLSRRSILDLRKRKMPFSKCLDLDYLAARTENYSGADICNLCNEAALQAIQRNVNCEEIVMEDFENVLKMSKSSLDQNQINWYYEFENKCL